MDIFNWYIILLLYLMQARKKIHFEGSYHLSKIRLQITQNLMHDNFVIYIKIPCIQVIRSIICWHHYVILVSNYHSCFSWWHFQHIAFIVVIGHIDYKADSIPLHTPCEGLGFRMHSPLLSKASCNSWLMDWFVMLVLVF